jgi:hypothetical protein
MPATTKIATLILAAAFATALPGCGAPEGFASIDADAARQALVTPTGQSKFPVKPRGPKRPAGPTVASRRR